MIVEFLDDARQELIEAALWYEGKEPGLGKRFRDEIAFIVNRIEEDPFLWHERDGGYRRANCPIFPYYLPFFIRGEKIILAAVAHTHRQPGYWQSRITS